MGSRRSLVPLFDEGYPSIGAPPIWPRTLNTSAMRERTPITWAAAACWVLLVALTSPAQIAGSPGRRGVVISEIHHQSRGDGMPTYIELQNLDPNNSPVSLAGAVLVVRNANGGQTALTLPQAATLPPYTPTVNSSGSATPGSGTLTLVDPNGPGLILPNETTLPIPSLFAMMPGALNPNQPWTVCLFVPMGAGGTASFDTVMLNGGTGACGPMSAPFNGMLPYGGAVIRSYRVDSNTFHDFIDLPPPGQVPLPDPPYGGPPVRPTPTVVNPEMARVSGFFFGATQNRPQDGGIPFTTQPPPPVPVGSNTGTISGLTSIPGGFAGQIDVSTTPAGQVAWIGFDDHPYQAFREQRDPIFDPVLTAGSLGINMTMLGNDPFLGHEPAGANAPPVATMQQWGLTVPSQIGPAGVLNIDMGPLEQVDLGFQFFQLNPTTNPQELRLRIERVLTDNLTDAVASGTGNLSPVQIDILPPEGDLWCELIVYDGNGFSYRAKVRDWPSNPLSCSGTGTNLGLGSNAPGNIDVIALCFEPAAELYLLPSGNLPATQGTGPFFGLNPDTLTFYALGQSLGANPWHSTTTADGLYYWSLTNVTLSGLTVDGVAVQWGLSGPSGSGFTQASPVSRVTVL